MAAYTIGGWKKGWMDSWMDGQMDGRMERWMDGLGPGNAELGIEKGVKNERGGRSF